MDQQLARGGEGKKHLVWRALARMHEFPGPERHDESGTEEVPYEKGHLVKKDNERLARNTNCPATQAG